MSNTDHSNQLDRERARCLEVMQKALHLKHECEVLKKALGQACKELSYSGEYGQSTPDQVFEHIINQARKELNDK